MAAQSPLQLIRSKHGSKAELVAKLVPLIAKVGGESDDEQKKRLMHVANRKLLHLLALGERAEELGGRDGIVKKIAGLKGQPKDHEFSDRLAKLSLGQLLDRVTVLERKAKRAKAQ